MDKFDGMIYLVLAKLENEGKIISIPINDDPTNVLIRPADSKNNK